MKNQLLYFFTLLSFLVSCEKKDKIHFKIEGEIKGIENETLIYLKEFGQEAILDSTLVINDFFSFRGSVKHPKLLQIKIPKSTTFSPFWVENSNIKFVADNYKSKESSILGSISNDNSKLYHEKVNPYYKEIDSLKIELKDKGKSKKEKRKILKQKSFNYSKIDDLTLEFVENNPTLWQSLFLLSIHKRYLGQEKVSDIFSKMSLEMKESKYGREIQQYLDLPSKPNIGDKFVDFSLESLDGKTKSILGSKNKITLIEFWASWCGPCRASHPDLIKLYDNYKSKGFNIISVSFDHNKKLWTKAIQKDSINWVNLIENRGFNSDMSLVYQINSLPSNYLINEREEVIGINLRDSLLIDKIQKLFD